MPLLQQVVHADRLSSACRQIAVGDLNRHGSLCCVADALGLVVFAHANGFTPSSRSNRDLARRLRQRRLDTLEFELLAPEEPRHDLLKADIELLAERLLQAIDALPTPQRDLPIGLFGSANASAGALRAASRRPQRIAAVVSRGGRPDLAEAVLGDVRAPTLLLVGAADVEVLEFNRQAYTRLRCTKRIDVVPRATHLFLEAGALETVASLAADWFCTHLPAAPGKHPTSAGR